MAGKKKSKKDKKAAKKAKKEARKAAKRAAAESARLATYATVFALIWVSYLGSDALSEIVGSLWGKQALRVWGIGEVNRKSLAGTGACFVGSLAIGLSLVHANGLGLAWVGLAVAVSVSNTAFELFSPGAPTTSPWRPPTRSCAGPCRKPGVLT